jgi:hypothetical protein
MALAGDEDGLSHISQPCDSTTNHTLPNAKTIHWQSGRTAPKPQGDVPTAQVPGISPPNPPAAPVHPINRATSSKPQQTSDESCQAPSTLIGCACVSSVRWYAFWLGWHDL